MRFLIDVAVERAVHGGKFPQTSLCGLSVQRCLLVPPLRDEALEHLALALGGTSKIVLHAVDPHEHLAEAPAPMRERPHRLGPAATDLGRKDGAKPPPPEARRLVRDIDTALVQKVLDVAQRKWVANVHYYREADDLGRCLEIAENVSAELAVDPTAAPVYGKPVFLRQCPAQNPARSAR